MRQIAEALLETVPPELLPQLEKEMRLGWHREAVECAVNQKRIARANHSTPRKSIDGIGQLRMRIDPTAYHFWGQKLGYDCWRDKQFLHEFERDNPEVRVISGGTKFQLGYSGKPKYLKKYDS